MFLRNLVSFPPRYGICNSDGRAAVVVFTPGTLWFPIWHEMELDVMSSSGCAISRLEVRRVYSSTVAKALSAR